MFSLIRKNIGYKRKVHKRKIDKRFDKLLTGLRTAVANEYRLQKEETSYDDIVDDSRLSL
jgi:hypothetical protein